MGQRQKSQINSSGYHLQLWEKASGAVSGDDFLVLPLPDRLRLAVFDGVTETVATEKLFSATGDSFAAGIARTAFKDSRELELIAADVNNYLNSFAAERTRDLPQTTAIIADIYPQRIELLRAGDCEAWIGEQGKFRSLFPEPMLDPEKRQQFLAWRAAHPEAGAEESFSAEEEYFGQVEVWKASTLGRFRQARYQLAVIEDPWEELILATDGAHLNQEVVGDLEHWQEWVLQQTLDSAYKKVDDFLLLSCRPADADF